MRKLDISLVLLIAAALLVIALGIPGGTVQWDSEWYRYLAEGQNAKVIQPFASRGLEPFIVRLLDRTLHLAPDAGFAIVASISLLICFLCISAATKQTVPRIRWITAILLLSVWTTLFHAFLLPDIFHSALLAIFCLLLRKERYWEAALMFAPLYAARESTALVLVVFLIAGAGKVKFRIMLAAVAGAAAGFGFEKWLVVGSQGNSHHISQLVYFTGKVPFNVLQNILGFEFWANTLPSICAPTHIYHLPSWRLFGSIAAIGPCEWQPLKPATTLMLWLGSFGILPVALMAAMRGRWKEIWEGEVFPKFCIIYGLAAFVAGPTLGSSVYRLVAYGWPAFALALPILSPGFFEKHRALLPLQLALSWLTWLVIWQVPSGGWVLGCIFASLAGWLFTIFAIRHSPTSMSVAARPRLTGPVAFSSSRE